ALPAPAQAALAGASPSAQAVAGAMASDPGWRAALAQSGQPAGRTPGVQALHIQLHPAELGSVIARLRLVGDRLSVDIEVETGGAQSRLASDSDAIAKALRSLGFEVDRITVQQGQGTATAQGNGTGSAAGRDGTGGQTAAGRGDGGTGSEQQRGHQHDGKDDEARRPGAAPTASGGVYI
ncbi:flagellar hook-length control protein FliK, partial [Aquibium sp. A9E412]|uniref:flagellar hook-length control protein FliK n=1 Tax=Aquibium sp. A9E412 TaxID=2976767 RepID=UPI0025B0F92D